MKTEYTSAKQAMVVTLMPSLQERISRINAIQKRTAIRNKRLLKGVWNVKEDETLNVNIHLSIEQG
ncbi:MAG: hypothetical protein E6Q59_08185 [Nitrosomonas sp.]|nr:MAG: hypothetical protein E6Q59_08185 [Nitrosomonas sp.]